MPAELVRIRFRVGRNIQWLALAIAVCMHYSAIEALVSLLRAKIRRTSMKKKYVAPGVSELGSASSDTRSGQATNSDVQPFVQNTAFPEEPENGS